VQTHPRQVVMKEKKTRNGLRLLVTFDKVKTIDKALEVLKPLDFKSQKAQQEQVS